MSDLITRLPEPEVLIERLKTSYWREKYIKCNSFTGPEESHKILQEFFKSLESRDK